MNYTPKRAARQRDLLLNAIEWIASDFSGSLTECGPKKLNKLEMTFSRCIDRGYEPHKTSQAGHKSANKPLQAPSVPNDLEEVR